MSTSDDIAAYLSTLLTLLFGISVLIVFRFAETGFPWHTYITLSIGYFVGFGIIVLVPIDIATVVYDRKSTLTEAEGDPIYTENRREIGTAYAVLASGVHVSFASIEAILVRIPRNWDPTDTCIARFSVHAHNLGPNIPASF